MMLSIDRLKNVDSYPDKNPRWAAPMLIWKFRQQGVRNNHKRFRQLYRLEGLVVRRQ